MKYPVILCLLFALKTASAQTITYNWEPVVPGIMCNDSDYSYCSIKVLLNDTAHNILWISGKFQGADTTHSSNLVGYNGHGYVAYPFADSLLDIRAMVMYNNRLIIAERKKVSEYNLDSGKLKLLGVFYTSGSVRCMTIYKGDLIVAGDFYTVEEFDSIGQSSYIGADNIVRWDGQHWNSMGGGVTGGVSGIFAMKAFHDTLFVGGVFDFAGSALANNIGLWDGYNWYRAGCLGSNVQSGNTYAAFVETFEVLNNILYVGGDYDSICNKKTYVAKWNGITWNKTNFPCKYISQLKNFRNRLIVIDHQGGCEPFIFHWDEINNTPVDTALNSPPMVEVFNGELYGGGNFSFSGKTNLFRFARLRVDTSVGTSSIILENKTINVYPNPVEDKLTVSGEQLAVDAELKITDILGRIILSQQSSGNTKLTIDISNLSPGVYLLSMKGKEGMIVRKFVKE